ncbi:MAG: hypothetical protein NZ527_02990, partial [Hydrogenobacter thermophilus]|nr:hypothetical protein [Hydrogenobacter thermophilus]
YFILLVIVLGASAYLVFLNQQPVSIWLTPQMGEYAYATYQVPLGLLVLLFFFSGLVLGYLLHSILNLLR